MRLKSVGFFLFALLLLTGCAAQNILHKGRLSKLTPTESLHANLDRYDHWVSLFAKMKLGISVHDTTFAAKGHLMYLEGERYEVGFEKPYSRFLGTFYLTPSQFVYFDVRGVPQSYTLKDTVILTDLLPLGLPNWDPRDLLPFPVSGRTAGFQTDSILTGGGRTLIYGSSDNVSYMLALEGRNGTVVEEKVQRSGRDLVSKRYERVKTFQGWPVATRVACADQAGDIKVRWSLSGIQLKAPAFGSQDSISTSR